ETLDEAVVLTLLHRDLEFWCRHSLGQLSEDFLRRASIQIASEDFQEPCRGVDAVIEAVPALTEKEMAAHLAGQLRIGFLHLGLDQRVTRLPHDRAAAVLQDHGL